MSKKPILNFTHDPTPLQLDHQAFGNLLRVMLQLRDPVTGCPWDVAQDFASIVPYTIEEAYEVAGAIDSNNPSALKEELGDLLLQVIFHSQMAREANWFTFNDVVAGLAEKLISRHPHVFADNPTSSDANQVRQDWDKQKNSVESQSLASASEKMQAVPLSLPALKRAEKIQKKAAQIGFDWQKAGQIIDKITEELHEVSAVLDQPDALFEEIGDLLFAVSNLARFMGIDGEEALRQANLKFTRRFSAVEAELARRGKQPSAALIDEMEEIWQAQKSNI